MASANFNLTLRYYQLGSHLLIWLVEVKSWMLLDLEEISQTTGKTQEEILASLSRKNEVK